MEYETLTVDAIDIQPADVFERHGREWTAVDVGRGWYGCARVSTGNGAVWMPADEKVEVRRPVDGGSGIA
ncbi:hypothetical protein [Streptomyces sparsogenes]|uniref:hypothetical protein n=1 Tax=Streptomyces sparsogenes TaxID=67365 RepID=UPI0033FC15FC